MENLTKIQDHFTSLTVDVRKAVPALQMPLDVLPADLPLGRLHKLRAGLPAPAEQ